MAETVCYRIKAVRETRFAHSCFTFRKNLLILGRVFFLTDQCVISFVNRAAPLCMKTGTSQLNDMIFECVFSLVLQSVFTFVS